MYKIMNIISKNKSNAIRQNKDYFLIIKNTKQIKVSNYAVSVFDAI